MKKRITQAFCLLIVLFLLISTPFSAEEKSQKADLNGFEEFVTKTMEEWKVTEAKVTQPNEVFTAKKK